MKVPVKFYIHVCILISLMAMFSGNSAYSQQRTVGLISKDAASDRGYTLIAPVGSTTTYLIDGCGYVVHQWSSLYKPSFAVYLLENGDLLRMVRVDTTASGVGIERRSWDGEIQWLFTLPDSIAQLHHDVRLMPNGNFLVAGTVSMTRSEAISAGRDTSYTVIKVDAEQLLEIKPIGTDSGEIVWLWNSMDHMIQDRDSTLSTFGKVSEHPGKLDFNYYDQKNGSGWCHVNSIDYDHVFDRILVSSRAFSEVWIIDHSTTTEEAKGTTGGTSGRGGEILYRWGNPRAYQRGTASDQKFFSQHNAHWFNNGESDSNSIMVFNNGVGRPGKVYATVDVLKTPMDENGNFDQSATEAYGPETIAWQFKADPDTSMFSQVMGSAARLSNGNTLICEGSKGKITEVDATGHIVWQYVSPVGVLGVVEQGAVPKDPRIFRGPRFSQDYPAFTGRTLVPGSPIELAPWPYECSITGPMTSVEEQESEARNLTGAPNPFSVSLTLSAKATSVEYRIVDATGTVVQSGTVTENESVIDTSLLSAGLYFLINNNGAVQKLIKLN